MILRWAAKSYLSCLYSERWPKETYCCRTMISVSPRSWRVEPDLFIQREKVISRQVEAFEIDKRVRIDADDQRHHETDLQQRVKAEGPAARGGSLEDGADLEQQRDGHDRQAGDDDGLAKGLLLQDVPDEPAVARGHQASEAEETHEKVQRLPGGRRP